MNIDASVFENENNGQIDASVFEPEPISVSPKIQGQVWEGAQIPSFNVPQPFISPYAQFAQTTQPEYGMGSALLPPQPPQLQIGGNEVYPYPSSQMAFSPQNLALLEQAMTNPLNLPSKPEPMSNIDRILAAQQARQREVSTMPIAAPLMAAGDLIRQFLNKPKGIEGWMPSESLGQELVQPLIKAGLEPNLAAFISTVPEAIYWITAFPAAEGKIGELATKIYAPETFAKLMAGKRAIPEFVRFQSEIDKLAKAQTYKTFDKQLDELIKIAKEIEAKGKATPEITITPGEISIPAREKPIFSPIGKVSQPQMPAEKPPTAITEAPILPELPRPGKLTPLEKPIPVSIPNRIRTFTDGSKWLVQSEESGMAKLMRLDGDEKLTLPISEVESKTLTTAENKPIEMHAGIGLVPVSTKDLSGGMIKTIQSLFRKMFWKAGNVEPKIAEGMLVAAEKQAEAKAIGYELGRKLVYYDKNLPYFKREQNAAGDILEGTIKSAKDLELYANMEPVKAQKLFKDTIIANDARKALWNKLYIHGVIDDKLWEAGRDFYVPRLYRMYEYPNITKQSLLDIAKRLKTTGDEQGKFWAEAIERQTYDDFLTGERTKLDAFYQDIRRTIQETAKNPAMIGKKGDPGFVYTKGKEWGELSGKYIPENKFKIIRQSINNLDKSKAELTKFPKGGFPKGKLDMTYLKKKGDLTSEQLEYLGEIKEPGYAMAKRIYQMGADVAKYDFFDMVAKAKGQKIPGGIDGWETFKGKEWGPLDGYSLPKEYAGVVKNLDNEFRGIVSNQTKLMEYWKEIHTIWNPATHARNWQNNMILLNIYYGAGKGMNPLEHIRVINHFVQKDVFMDIARRSALLKGGIDQEIGGLLDRTLESLKQNPTYDDILKSLLKLDTYLRPVRNLYKFGDDYAKMFAFRQELQKTGINPENLVKEWTGKTEAQKMQWVNDIGRKTAREAKDAIPTYDQIPNWVRNYSRNPVYGVPFVSYYWAFSTRSIPKMAKMIAKGDIGLGLRLFTFLSIPGTIAWYQKRAMTQREKIAEMEERPDYLRNPVADILRKNGKLTDGQWIWANDNFGGNIPVGKDKYGRRLYYNINYTSPFQQFLKPDYAGNPMQYILQNPITKMVAEIAANKNIFYDREIVSKGDDTYTSMKKILNHIRRNMLPTMAGGDAMDKWIATIKKTQDRQGRVFDPMQTFLRTIMGIPITAVDKEKTLSKDVFDFKKAIQGQKQEMKNIRIDLLKKKIDPTQAQKRTDEIKTNIQRLIREFNIMHSTRQLERPAAY